MERTIEELIDQIMVIKAQLTQNERTVIRKALVKLYEWDYKEEKLTMDRVLKDARDVFLRGTDKESFSKETIKRLEDAIRDIEGDVCVICVSKENLKKAVEIFKSKTAMKVLPHGICPMCGTELDVWNFCPVCGQKLDWNYGTCGDCKHVKVIGEGRRFCWLPFDERGGEVHTISEAVNRCDAYEKEGAK